MSPMQPNCQNCSKTEARVKELEQALWECLRAMTDSASLLRDAYPVVAGALDDRRSLRAAEKVIAKTQAVIEDLDRQRDALAQAQQVMVGELGTMKACLERYLRVKDVLKLE